MIDVIMKNIRKIVCFFLILILSIPPVLAYKPSKWAQADVEEIIENDIMPQVLLDKEYTDPITRGEFCYLIVNMYKNLSKNEDLPLGIEGFADTFDMTICSAAELGIINGYTDGFFYPDNPINRQELASIICRTLKLCGVDTTISKEISQMQFDAFDDVERVADWASDNVAYCLANSIIKGLSDTQIAPLDYTSREQAIVIVNRCIKTFSSQISYVPPIFSQDDYDSLSCDVSGDVALVSYIGRALTIEWAPIKDAAIYHTDLYLSAENFWYTDEDILVKSITTTEPLSTFKNMRAGKHYNISISAIDEAGSIIKTISGKTYPNELYTLEEREAIIFGGGNIYSKSAADAQMQEVTVKVWAVDKSGNKSPSTLSFTVHKNIAQIVERAFDEIFNGEEKFPFKDAGGYSWRDTMSSGRYSHHNYGTAIDLNYNENYCIYKDGSYIGVHWKPGEDIYSFPPDGEVISIFAKYGFAWGGDEWSNPKDYMHFSYLEL